MGRKDLSQFPQIVEQWIEFEREANEKYYTEHPDALTLQFENELRELGFEFEVLSQTKGFMPRCKEVLLPIAIRYYRRAESRNDRVVFLSYFPHKGFEEVVPLLLESFDCTHPDRALWQAGNCLYEIRSKEHVDDYLKIIAEPVFGTSRQMVVSLVGKLKVEKAVPILIRLLEDEDVRLHAITALGDFKREEFRPYFERFENDKHPGWRKYSRAALKKLDKQKEKNAKDDMQA